MVRRRMTRSDNGTGEHWHGVTLVQTKTGTEWQWYRRRLVRGDWYRRSLIGSDTGTGEDCTEWQWYMRRMTRSDNGTGEHWHGVTLVQDKTDKEWLVQAKTDRERHWYRRRLQGVTMIQAKNDTEWHWYRIRLTRSDTGRGENCTEWQWCRRRLARRESLNWKASPKCDTNTVLTNQQYKHYVNQSANRITVIPNAIFAVLLLTFRLNCTNCSGGGYMFCSMHPTQHEHSTHSSGYRSRLNFHVQ